MKVKADERNMTLDAYGDTSSYKDYDSPFSRQRKSLFQSVRNSVENGSTVEPQRETLFDKKGTSDE